MRIFFIGHSHHQVTRSSDFFVDLLRQLGPVEHFWDDTWRGEAFSDLPPAIGEADLVVVWQSVRYARLLARRGHPNVVYVPMYDAAKTLRRSFWSALRDVKILNFSSTLHQRVQSLGAPRSAYFQYFPDPAAYPVVDDFTTLRAFFWQRQVRPAWRDVRRLLSSGHFATVHLHLAMDPNCPAPEEPSALERQERTMEVTHWLPDRKDLLTKLASANVYCAPRLDEGIGLAFLEAMAMGMAVCAHDSPTHSEYIVDGVNGYLYRLGTETQPDWSKAAAIGHCARRSIEKGHLRWRREQARLTDFLTQPKPTRGTYRYVAVPAPDPTGPELAVTGEPAHRNIGQGIGEREGGKRFARPVTTAPQPLVTVATVVRNASEQLALTLDSSLNQTFPSKEILVIDGASDDATQAVIERYGDRIDYWSSAADRGPYDAMNKAADRATGRWILYINAGDMFVDDEALARLMSDVPAEADFIAAHHVYVAPDGTEEIHRCIDFDRTYRSLLAGDTDGRWLGGIPGHQSLLTRVELIRQHRYDLGFRIAADHEFLFRMRQHGASVHVEPVILSQYVGGGLSWTHLLDCIAEWRRIALRYSQHPERVSRHFRQLTAHTFRYARRMAPFDWCREPARSHPALALAAEAEFRLRAVLDRVDAVYARIKTP